MPSQLTTVEMASTRITLLAGTPVFAKRKEHDAQVEPEKLIDAGHRPTSIPMNSSDIS